MAVPVAVVVQSGETAEANRAFVDLANRCQCRPSLNELFGAAFHRILARAWIERHIQSTLPVLSGPEPRPTFRASFLSTADAKTLGVVLYDVTAELECRRLLTQRDSEFNVLRDIGAALSSTLDLDELVVRIHEATNGAIPCENIFIALHEKETGTITFPRYLEDGQWKEMTSRPWSNGLTEYLLLTGQPLLINERVQETLAELGVDPFGRPCLSWLGAPMVVDSEPVGVIAVQDYESEGVYNPHDLELLTLIASQAAAGVKNARAIIAERHAHHEVSEAQARLIETERLRGVTETVAALNHEVNNPLAAIAGNAQLLIRKSDGIPPAAIHKIQSIYEAARRIQRVTAKMASLIQASSMPYPGDQAIIDVANSVAREEAPEDDADLVPPDSPFEAQERPLSAGGPTPRRS
jgi:GAF domain-containing protein